MIIPVRLQLSRCKGFDLQRLSMETNGLPAVRAARPGRLGNPFVVGDLPDRRQLKKWGWQLSPAGLGHVCADAAEAVSRFWHCLLWDEAIHDEIRKIAGGHNVACYCGGSSPCHVNSIITIANSTPASVHALQEIIDRALIESAKSLT